ncbi:MAG: plasmid pRiA4b ORF-3 family protein, partial [Actinomycetes bacterium]
MPDEKTPEDLRRQFEAAISGMELDDLHDLTARPLSYGDDALVPPPPVRPHLRRPPRETTVIYQIRVDLDHAKPPIWRRLEVRSDLTLDLMHQVLQAAFDWTDSHLHRFAIGGGPFDRTAELFLCPFDVEEGEDDGAPSSSVRLDETLHEHGDALRYVYDYGDSWELTLRLEEVRAAGPANPVARCLDGRRAAPPEDCGGRTDADDLAEVVEDPARFDIDEVNDSLRSPLFALTTSGMMPRFVTMVAQLHYADGCAEFAERLASLATPVAALSTAGKGAALASVQWFLDQGAGDGLELTASGYLKPKAVQEACAVLPTMDGWLGKNNRENLARPLLIFRHRLQDMGLLRKYRGRLLLRKSAAPLRNDTEALWDHVAAGLVPSEVGFARDATLLLLGCVAAGDARRTSLRQISRALTYFGWRRTDGSDVEPEDLDVLELDLLDVLWNIADEPPP